MADPRITDAAVQRAAQAYWETEGNRAVCMRAALEAALPDLAPQPMVDPAAVDQVLRVHGIGQWGGELSAGRDYLVQALVALALPMPTRNQLEQALQECGIGSYRTIVADAVLALLDGGGDRG